MLKPIIIISFYPIYMYMYGNVMCEHEQLLFFSMIGISESKVSTKTLRWSNQWFTSYMSGKYILLKLLEIDEARLPAGKDVWQPVKLYKGDGRVERLPMSCSNSERP